VKNLEKVIWYHLCDLAVGLSVCQAEKYTEKENQVEKLISFAIKHKCKKYSLRTYKVEHRGLLEMLEQTCSWLVALPDEYARILHQV